MIEKSLLSTDDTDTKLKLQLMFDVNKVVCLHIVGECTIDYIMMHKHYFLSDTLYLTDGIFDLITPKITDIQEESNSTNKSYKVVCNYVYIHLDFI